jgi:hypothetical protein
MTFIKATLLLCATAALLAVPLLAQAPASLRGVVTDPSGASVPGATITLTGPNSLVKVVQSDSTGSYSIPGLPPGSYTVRVGATGFALFEKTGLDLAAARAVTLDAKLVLATERQVVTVEDTQHVELDPSQNAGALVLKGQDLDMLSDDPDDLQADLQALAGPSVGPNGGQIFVDGFSNGQLPPKDSIREIRINSNPFSAEFDKVGFGRIEILTKPGSDKFHGTFFVFGDTSAIDSRNPFALSKPSILNEQVQGNLSGPINKKTSFFVDVSRRNLHENALVDAVLPSPNFSSTVPFNVNVPAPATRTSISPRIDYQLTPSITLQARYTWTQLAAQGTAVGQLNLPSQALTYGNTAQSAQLTETWVINPQAINETRFQYTRTTQTQNGNNTIPAVNLNGYFQGGGAGLSNFYDLQNSFELQNYTTLTRGKHFVKLGARMRGTTDNDRSNSNFLGTYTYSSLAAYTATALGLAQGESMAQIIANGGGPAQYQVNVPGLTSPNGFQNVGMWDAAPFIQDDWRLVPSFTLSLGLRYEFQNTLSDKRDWAPRAGFAWGIGGGQGRLRQPKLVIRGGFGIFYDRFALTQILNAARFNGVNQQKYVIDNPQFACVLADAASATSAVQCSSGIPTTSPQLAGLGQAGAIYQIDPGLVAPRILQTNIGFDRQLPKNTTLSVNYTHSLGEHELRTRDINAPLPGTYTGVAGSGVYPEAGYPIGGQPIGTAPLYQYESGGLFKQYQLIANVNSRISAGLQLFGYYVYGHASSNTDGVTTFPSNQYDLSTEWSRAAFDVRNRLLVGGNIAIPFGIRLAPMIMFNSAPPFNIVLPGDPNGDGLFNQRPTFAQYCSATLACNSTSTAPLPRNYGNGFDTFVINLRVSRTWGFGEATTTNGRRPQGGGGGAGGRGFGGGVPRGGGGPGGPGGFFGGAQTGKRYNVTLSAEVRNLLNTVNPGSPVGTLGSPLYGESQTIVGGFGGNNPQTANRRIQLQLRFNF